MARRSTVLKSAYFQKVAVSATTFGATDPDIIIGPFIIEGLTFNNEGSGATNVVEYSFDGVHLHGEMDATKASANLIFRNRQVSTVWFRVKSGSTGPVTIRVEAWG